MIPNNYWLYLQILFFLFITPGSPRIVMCSYTMTYGLKKSAWTAIGDISANSLQLLLVVLGFGLIVKENPFLLLTLKWMGVGYLLYLAYDLYKSKVEIISPSRAIIYLPEREIPAIIGQGGKRIHNIEDQLGIKLTIKPLETKKEPTKFNSSETKKYITFEFSKSLSKKSAEFNLEDSFLFSAIVSNRGEIKIHKKSEIGRKIIDAIDTNKKLEILI